MHPKKILTQKRSVDDLLERIECVLTHEEALAQNLRPASALARRRLASYLQRTYPRGYCRIVVAPNGRLRLLVIDDRFNGMDVLKKHDYVVDGLKRAVARGELAKAHLARVSSVEVFSTLELV